MADRRDDAHEDDGRARGADPADRDDDDAAAARRAELRALGVELAVLLDRLLERGAADERAQRAAHWVAGWWTPEPGSIYAREPRRIVDDAAAAELDVPRAVRGTARLAWAAAAAAAYQLAQALHAGDQLGFRIDRCRRRLFTVQVLAVVTR